MNTQQIVQAILTILTIGPAVIDEATSIYNKVKSDLSETDQAKIDQALADAQKSDAAATNHADAALEQASQK
jgi:hypothetical protein